MLLKDFIKLTGTSILAQKLRSFLTMLGITVGITAVVLLTSIGEGLYQFVLSEFSQFGTTLIAINPGRTKTHGMSVGVFGTVRPLTIEDAETLKHLPYVKSVVPVVQGNAEIEGNGRTRRTTVHAVGTQFPATFSVQVRAGRFLPDDDPTAPRAFVVLGSKVKNELFGSFNPLGQRIRIGGDRYRVIGVMEEKGQILGIDLDDTVYIPTARGLELFNREGLMEIDLLYKEGTNTDIVVSGIKRLLEARHGREDFTVTTQQQMLDVLGSILNVLTFAVGAIGSISLLVGGIGIITIMTISVNERTSEIGLLRALGARQTQILSLFLGEAIVLSAIGGTSGLLLGIGIAQLLHFALPALPVHTPWTFVFMAEGLSILIGLAAGVLPARRAARLDAVEALRSE
jgi:putative ABC transport system permease protein